MDERKVTKECHESLNMQRANFKIFWPHRLMTIVKSQCLDRCHARIY